tara:strand:+ start:1055 stop:1747 length:693 start_codon:yes stop_codon:yes gene_type:complete
MTSSAIKRIINKDIKEVSNKNLNSLGIYIEFNEENLFEAKAMIVGPKDSLYDGGFLFFNITFPKNYPYSPPTLKYISQNIVRIHPNLYVNGKVCLSILGTWSGEKWSSIMDITTILLTIQSLLDNNPFNHEPGHENKINESYNQIIQYNSLSSLIVDRYKRIPHSFEIFQNNMDETIKLRYNHLFNKIKQIKNENEKSFTATFPFYSINLTIDYDKLFRDYQKLFNKFDN